MKMVNYWHRVKNFREENTRNLKVRTAEKLQADRRLLEMSHRRGSEQTKHFSLSYISFFWPVLPSAAVLES